MPYSSEGIYIFGTPEQNALDQMKRSMDDERVSFGVMCADSHQGYCSMPVGGVVAFQKEYISPSGVGVDIGCGNKAVRLDLKATNLLPHINEVMDDIWNTISFGVGRKNNELVEHVLFSDDPAWAIRPVHSLKQLAENQLGTVGAGNHFVDVFSDENDDVWIGVHFGSRGFGNKIARHYIEASGGKDSVDSPPIVLATDSFLGDEYVAAMQLAGRYAYAGRDWVCSRVASILNADIVEEVHNNHNLAWLENHFGEDLWVIRKGATPAAPGQKGFIGGTMGDISVIIEGVAGEENEQSLRSTVHGAGRIMSRTQAAGHKHFDKKKGQFVRDGSGKISRGDMLGRLEKFHTVLRGADTDEAPQCYKNIEEVLAFHSESIKILHTLHPLGVCMAGDEFDPYKD